MTRKDWITLALCTACTIFGLAALWINPTNPALVLMTLAAVFWTVAHIDKLAELDE